MGHKDHQHDPDYAELCRHLEAVPAAVGRLEQVLARNAIPGSWQRMRFTQAAPRVVDDNGANALALAIYNPNEFRVYVGVGGSAAPDSFVVPKKKLVVAPIQVNGAVEFLGDEGDLAAGAGFVWRVRFSTPQPFFVGSL